MRKQHSFSQHWKAGAAAIAYGLFSLAVGIPLGIVAYAGAAAVHIFTAAFSQDLVMLAIWLSLMAAAWPAAFGQALSSMKANLEAKASAGAILETVRLQRGVEQDVSGAQ